MLGQFSSQQVASRGVYSIKLLISELIFFLLFIMYSNLLTLLSRLSVTSASYYFRILFHNTKFGFHSRSFFCFFYLFLKLKVTAKH